MKNIVVLARMVPDLVEELEIDPAGQKLDTTWLRQIINEFDDHAIEAAILLKEKTEAYVTIIAPEADGANDVLYTARAKGADKLVMVRGDFETTSNHALGRLLADQIRALSPDLILTGVQAHNDVDGSLGSLLAECLSFPYVGYISGIRFENGSTVLRKEYPAGLVAEVAVELPAVVGIQAAEQPPRYIAVSKVRQAMGEAQIESWEPDIPDDPGGLQVKRMFQPEATGHAVMLEGDEDEVARKLVEIFKELGVL